MGIEIKEYNYGERYFPKLFVAAGKIVDAQCKCKWGQVHKNAWKDGEKICKHLECSIREFHMEIKNRKQKKGKMLGPMRCPEWLKHAYKKAVDFTCEDTGKVFPEEELEIHRIISGYQGGTYRPGNVKVLSEEAHKKYAEDW